TIERLIAAVIAALASRGLTVSGIGVGAPGPVDVEAGRVGEPAPHAGDLVGQPIGARLTTRFGVPVVVDNDVNALALAEWRFGAGRGARSLVVLAPGTGFGAGVILDGRLVRGVAGFGGAGAARGGRAPPGGGGPGRGGCPRPGPRWKAPPGPARPGARPGPPGGRRPPRPGGPPRPPPRGAPPRWSSRSATPERETP